MAEPDTSERHDRAGLSYRSFGVRMDDEGGEKVIRGIITTEQAVPMFDWERMDWVPEVLLTSGMELPPSRQIPLLDSHMRSSLDNQLGSIRAIESRPADTRSKLPYIDGELHFASTDDAQRAKAKMDEGHVTDMSAGYQIDPRASVHIPAGQSRAVGGKTFSGPINVRTKWRLNEGSLVAIGADDMAKIRGFESMADAIARAKLSNQAPVNPDDTGRDADSSNGAGATADQGQTEEKQQIRNQPTTNPMSNQSTDPANAPAPSIDISGEREKWRKEEAERVSAIRAIAQQIGKPDFGDKCVAEGYDVAKVRELVLRDFWNQQPTHTANTFEGDNGGFSRSEAKDLSKFRILEMARQAIDPKSRLEGIYAEADQEARNECRESGMNIKGFGIPSKFLRYGQRDATATGGTGGSQGGTTVATEVRNIIDVFNSKLVFAQLGATMLNGLTGNVSFPKPVKGSDPTEKAEGVSGDEYDATWGSITLQPRRLPAFTTITKQLLMQSSVDVENWYRGQIGIQLAVRAEKKMINGTGSSNEPLGLVNVPSIGGVTTSGGLTVAEMLEFESDVDSADALMGSLGWLMPPALRAEFKGTVKESGYPVYLIGDDNTMNGYPIKTSTIVPANNLIFGNWADAMCAFWGGIDLQVDDKTGLKAGTIDLVWETFYDFAVTRAASFSIATDI